MEKVSFIVIGAGGRGTGYARFVKEYPEEGEVVAVCEPIESVRNRFADDHNIPAERRYSDWRDIVDIPKFADAVFICTQDVDHREPAVAMAAKGYHILLEKPMAPTPEDCKVIYDAVQKHGVMLAVCHVLRYTDFNRKLKSLIDSGLIGKIMSIRLLEPVGYWHQAHSFVRGDWRNEEESSPMLLAKSCHDIDLLNYLMPSNCAKVSSFGNLSHFNRKHQPAGAADRCTDCPEPVESKCPYSALKIYLRDRKDNWDQWPSNKLTPDATEESMMNALKNGPYGRCVYACDNDVVDHQVVNLEFADGSTASFTMSAFNKGGGRELFVMGELGTLSCTDSDIEHFDFLTDETRTIPASDGDKLVESSHGGGDFGLIKSFFEAVRNNDPSQITSGPEVSLESHLIVFAAEKARRAGTVETL